MFKFALFSLKKKIFDADESKVLLATSDQSPVTSDHVPVTET